MESFHCVVFVMVVMCAAVEAYEERRDVKIVPGCLNEEDFEKEYGQKMYKKLSYDKYKIQDIKKDSDRSFRVVNFNIDTKVENTFKFKWMKFEVSLVEQVDQVDDTDYESVALEVALLQNLTENGITPKFKTCAYEIREFDGVYRARYYIVLEKVDHNAYYFFKKRLSKNYTMADRIYKFLQMAMLIQKLHLLGYTHQDIKPFNFVSTDEKMLDFRLIDLSVVARDKSPGIGGTRYYFSPDKHDDKFTATFQQDAFAFALTLIKLIDEEGVFDKTINEECIRHPETFSDKCKESFIAGVEALKSKVELVTFFEYLKDHFFDEASPLNINDMMADLIKCYTQIDSKIPDDSPEKSNHLNGKMNIIVSKYIENVAAMKSKEEEKLRKQNGLGGASSDKII